MALAPDPVLVHDYLLVRRGAERTFLRMAEMWPTAPIATILYDAGVFDDELRAHAVRTSPLQRLGAKQSTFKAMLPAMTLAAERLDVSGHELIVSSSSAFAHGVRPDPGATHVCYCHTPFRYAWYERANGVRQVPRALRRPVDRSLERIRRWDREVAQRPTHYIANGKITQERMERFWGVSSEVVHPPVELERFAPDAAAVTDSVLFVGELVRHKRVDVLLEAARTTRTPVNVVGTGSDEARLREQYGDVGTFLGRVGDDALAQLYRTARALVVPNLEEFGITAVEAQASGRPVLAADGGGARETIRDGTTGYFFPYGDSSALAALLRDSSVDRLSSEDCAANAQRFSARRFQDELRREVTAACAR